MERMAKHAHSHIMRPGTQDTYKLINNNPSTIGFSQAKEIHQMIQFSYGLTVVLDAAVY